MYQNLEAILIRENIMFRSKVPGGELTTFRTGGLVDLVVYIYSAAQLKTALEALKGLPYRIVGNGSNLLIGGKGYHGVLVKLLSGEDEIRIEGSRLTAFAGALLSRCAVAAADAGLSGFECLHGIPGSVGGAVYMNAGAYGGTVADILASSTAWINGEKMYIPLDRHNFGYRESIYKENPDWVVMEASFDLIPGKKSEITEKMKELAFRRRSSQPLELPSAGSVFKRPEGYFAGKLIEDAGLKGKGVGGAQVSPKHAGFIVNTGRATPEDILRTIRLVQKTVSDQSGVRLQREVELLGEFEGMEGDLWSF